MEDKNTCCGNGCCEDGLGMGLTIGDEIPSFEGVPYFQNGKIGELRDKDLQGTWKVFIFYPADFTFVCPTELGELADYYDEFKKIGVEVYSVSTDSAYVHMAWSEASDTIKKIKYPMIADTTQEICMAFGTLILESGMANRGTYVVDPDGKVQAMEMTAGSIGRSAKELLRKVQAAQFVATHGEVCPASWTPGAKTLDPTDNSLVGNI